MTKSISETAVETLAIRIRKERKLQGLSQTELASLSGVSLNFLSQIELVKPTAEIGKVLSVLTTLGLEFKISHGKKGISQ